LLFIYVLGWSSCFYVCMHCIYCLFMCCFVMFAHVFKISSRLKSSKEPMFCCTCIYILSTLNKNDLLTYLRSPHYETSDVAPGNYNVPKNNIIIIDQLIVVLHHVISIYAIFMKRTSLYTLNTVGKMIG
jgi:hypothetical protein